MLWKCVFQNNGKSCDTDYNSVVLFKNENICYHRQPFKCSKQNSEHIYEPPPSHRPKKRKRRLIWRSKLCYCRYKQVIRPVFKQAAQHMWNLFITTMDFPTRLKLCLMVVKQLKGRHTPQTKCFEWWSSVSVIWY